MHLVSRTAMRQAYTLDCNLICTTARLGLTRIFLSGTDTAHLKNQFTSRAMRKVEDCLSSGYKLREFPEQ
jgi:hypothetical protein